ncbi:MAG: hypothetical protein KIH01_06475 [Candidatus Freyarchaeota archaeon]|nr:hypothetical protein [Candidatus Jordarchaeia archaeon]
MKETVSVSDDIEFMIDFGESKKLKQLAEIVTGLIGIILNAVGLLEDRINQLDSEIKALERKVNTLETRASAPPPLPSTPPLPSPEREYTLEHEPRPASAITTRAPAMTPAIDRSASTPKAPQSPASARMQLQSELKELFSRLRRSE